MNSRRDEVVNLKKVGLSYAEIGRRLGISRERARQIAGGNPSPRKASGGGSMSDASVMEYALGKWNNQLSEEAE